jgi:hypothetical protein
LQKYFSHPSLVIYFFATPLIKLKLGQHIGGELLIANHLEGLVLFLVVPIPPCGPPLLGSLPAWTLVLALLFVFLSLSWVISVYKVWHGFIIWPIKNTEQQSDYIHYTLLCRCTALLDLLPATANCAIMLSQNQCPVSNWHIFTFLHPILPCKLTFSAPLETLLTLPNGTTFFAK